MIKKWRSQSYFRKFCAPKLFPNENLENHRLTVLGTIKVWGSQGCFGLRTQCIISRKNLEDCILLTWPNLLPVISTVILCIWPLLRQFQSYLRCSKKAHLRRDIHTRSRSRSKVLICLCKVILQTSGSKGVKLPIGTSSALHYALAQVLAIQCCTTPISYPVPAVQWSILFWVGRSTTV